jgi:hypothetical protein
MNWLIKYRNNKKLAVVTGLLLAFTILTSQSIAYYVQSDNCSICAEVTEEDNENENVHFYLSQDAVSVSSIQLNFDKPFQVVFEFFLSEENNSGAAPESNPLNFQFFRNLFRLTIAPNAP